MIALSFNISENFTAITPAIFGSNIYDSRRQKIGFSITLAWLVWSLDVDYVYTEAI